MIRSIRPTSTTQFRFPIAFVIGENPTALVGKAKASFDLFMSHRESLKIKMKKNVKRQK